MRTVYACVFEVTVPPPETSAQGFERLVGLTAEWVEEFYTKQGKTCKLAFDGFSHEPMPRHTLLGSREETGVCGLVALEWSYPDATDAGLRWALTLQLARNGKHLEVSLSTRILSTHPIVKPLRYSVERPPLLDRILTSFPCFVGKTPIQMKPRELERTEVKHFIEDMLFSKDRWLPTIMISPTGEGEYLVDASELQRTLLGHAQVVILRDFQAARELTYALNNKELSCYLGAVRVYWPGFNLAAKPEDHALYLPDSIRWHTDNKQPLGQHLFRLLVGVSGFRFSNPIVARLVRQVLDDERQARWQHFLANSKSIEETHEILKELERAWDEVKQLRQEREEARTHISELTRELESHQAAWAAFKGGISVDDAPRPAAPSSFPSVAQAVKQAQVDFGATLLFLPSALDAAADSPYQWPEKVYTLFQALDELTRRWQQTGSLGTGWHHALKPKGFEYKEFISPTAKGKYGQHYTFTYEGQALLFENHVTIGAKSADTCISIHWVRDEARKKLVFGWCGRHLVNTQS